VGHLLGRELKPPYIPGEESYAEDKEEGSNDIASVPVSIQEEEADDHQDDDWSDPEPGWDSSF